MKDIPFEVIEAQCLLFLKNPVGMETYKRVEDTVKKYPEYFPWETKYNSINKSVHENYDKELSVLFDSFYPRTPMDIKPGEGIVAWESRQKVVKWGEPVDFDELSKNLTNKLNKDSDFKIAKKILWDKHYKKYKLKYQE